MVLSDPLLLRQMVNARLQDLQRVLPDVDDLYTQQQIQLEINVLEALQTIWAGYGTA